MSFFSSISATPPATPVTPLSANSTSVLGVSFGDMVDAINPLQHIPVVSSLYRAASGNSISGGSQVVGDTLYGGVFGLGSALVSLATSSGNVALKQLTGEDAGEHVMATLGLSAGSSSTATASAAAPTLLVANNVAALPAQAVASNAITSQVTAATNAIYHTTDTTRSNNLYQRAQSMDALNKLLVKMAV